MCNKPMLIYDYIKFVQLSVKEYVNYKQCLNSLRTALVCYLNGRELFKITIHDRVILNIQFKNMKW